MVVAEPSTWNTDPRLRARSRTAATASHAKRTLPLPRRGFVAMLALAIGAPFVTVLQAPQVLAKTATAISPTAYVANAGDGTVTPITTATGKAGGPITLPDNPQSMAIAPDGRTAYVVSGNGVTPIDTATRKTEASITAGVNNYGIAISPDGKTAYIAQLTSGVIPIDIATGTVGTAIPAGGEPIAIAITPDGKTAYVSNYGSTTVTPFTISTGVSGTPITVGNNPTAIAITPNGKTAYVAIYGNTIVPITTATGTAGAPITVGATPTAIAITPNGKTAYVANYGSNSVTPITTATGVAQTPITVGMTPEGIAITPDGKSVYVTNSGSGTVTPITTATGVARAPITVGTNPHAIVMSPDEAPLASFSAGTAVMGMPATFDATDSTPRSSAIATYSWNFGDGTKITSAVPTVSHTFAAVGSDTVTLTLTDVLGTSIGTEVFTGQTMSLYGGPDARARQVVRVYAAGGGPPPTAYVLGTNSVLPVDTATGTVGSAIAITSPHAIAISPDGRTAWVTSGTYGSTGFVTPIDTLSATVGSSIAVGSDAGALAISPNGKTVYVANQYSSTVIPVATATGTPGTPIDVGPRPIGVGNGPTSIAITPDGSMVWVLSDDGFANEGILTPIDTATAMAGSSTHLGDGVGTLAVTPDGKTLYVADSSAVYTIATGTGASGMSVSVGTGPNSIAISPDGRTAYVTNSGSDTVTPVDTATVTAGQPIIVGNGPFGIAVTPDGTTVFVSGRNSNTVTRINTATGHVRAPISVGAPSGIAISPDESPVASFSAGSAVAGSPTTFDASGSTAPSSPIATYAWNFGDGAKSATEIPTVSHTYIHAGSFTVILTLTDGAGTSLMKVFTGQTTSRNGSARARKSQSISVS